MALLDVRGLVKWYGPRKVVDGVSFQVGAGEVVGLLGPNGAGKTTSFRMTTGQVTPNEGVVNFDGQDVTRLPMFKRARLGMGYLSQEPSIFRKLTVEKNLLAILEALPRSRSLGRKLTRSERWDRADEALARFNLTQVRKNPAARCSGGEKRRLEIARCLVCEPLLILLDEPFAAVDPLTTEDIRHNIRDLATAGIGILLTDHNVREVLKITDRSYLIKDGRVICHGTPEEIKRDPVATREYLGNTFADDPVPLTLSAERTRIARVEVPVPLAPVIATLTLAAVVEPVRAEKTTAGLRPPLASVVFADPPPIPLTSAAPPIALPEPPRPVLPAAHLFAPASPTGTFSSSAQTLLDGEKQRRLVDQLADEAKWQDAWHDLSVRGFDAVPALLDGLERRDVKVRHLAFRLLEQVTGESLQFQSDGPDDVRMRQAAHLRAKFDRRKSA